MDAGAADSTRYDDPEPGPPHYFTWGGVRWYRRPKSGHYADRTGTLLHVAVWEHEHKRRLPGGQVVHHKDHDPSHNWAGNLVAQTRRDHLAEHGLLGRKQTDDDKLAISEAQRASWAVRKPREHTCAQCNGTFLSTGQRARFCTPEHRATFYREQRRAQWSQ